MGDQLSDRIEPEKKRWHFNLNTKNKLLKVFENVLLEKIIFILEW